VLFHTLFASSDSQSGGAGFIGSHATLRLLTDGHTVTVIDNLSRGNLGAIHALQRHVPAAGQRLRFVKADLGVKTEVARVFATSSPRVDLVIHFAASTC
jgi:UDP-arabinose 4-epimerase